MPLPPGVPPLLNGIDVFNTVAGDLIAIQNLLFPTPPPHYGLFDGSGTEVIQAYSRGRFQYARDYRIANHPIEQGGFASYNKVQLPFSAQLTYLCPGDYVTKATFLSTVGKVVKDTNLYTVVTPDASYPYANAIHYDYNREALRGFQMLTVTVWFEEIRQVQPSLPGSTTTQNTAGNTQSPNVNGTRLFTSAMTTRALFTAACTKSPIKPKL